MKLYVSFSRLGLGSKSSHKTAFFKVVFINFSSKTSCLAYKNFPNSLEGVGVGLGMKNLA